MYGQRLKASLDLLLLAAIDEQPGHGYAIATRLRERSDGAFDIAEGTLYPALHRMEGAGLLRSQWATVAGRRRRVYATTAAGAATLADERVEWRRFTSGVTAVLGNA